MDQQAHHEITASYAHYSEQNLYGNYVYQVPHQHLQQSNHQFQQPMNPPSVPHVSTMPIEALPPLPSPDIYDPLSSPISGSDTSADGLYNSSGQNSPSSSRGLSPTRKSRVRYNPTPSPSSSSGCTPGRPHDTDEEYIMGVTYAENLAKSRKETSRRQRVEAEQRRRDELRDGYARLKHVLPISNQKTGNVSLLMQATHHIVALEKGNQDLQVRIDALELELQRLHDLNEKITLDVSANGAPPGLFDARPSSQPPNVPSHPPPPSTASGGDEC